MAMNLPQIPENSNAKTITEKVQFSIYGNQLNNNLNSSNGVSSRYETRVESVPFHDDKKMKRLKEIEKEKQAKSAYPKKYTHCGWIKIRSETSEKWKRKWFVLNNNFLLCGDQPYSQKLAACIPLEGSKVTNNIKELTFELVTHVSQKKSKKNKKTNHSNNIKKTNEFSRKRKKFIFKTESLSQCTLWTEYIERASTLQIKDIYRLRYKLGDSASQSSKVLAAKHRISGDEFAIKILNKKKCDQNLLQKEIQILK